MANPPKPSALRLLAGNPGKRPINTREPVTGEIDLQAPPELSEAAVAHWNRNAPMLAKSGVLKQSDRDLLAAYAEAYAAFRASIDSGKLNVPLLGSDSRHARRNGHDARCPNPNHR
jgi:phage terminase small subunit